MSTVKTTKRLKAVIAQVVTQASKRETALTAEFLVGMIAGDSDSDVDPKPLLLAMALAGVRLGAFAKQQDALAHEFLEKRAAQKAGLARRAMSEAEAAQIKARGLTNDAV